MWGSGEPGTRAPTVQPPLNEVGPVGHIGPDGRQHRLAVFRHLRFQFPGGDAPLRYGAGLIGAGSAGLVHPEANQNLPA